MRRHGGYRVQRSDRSSSDDSYSEASSYSHVRSDGGSSYTDDDRTMTDSSRTSQSGSYDDSSSELSHTDTSSFYTDDSLVTRDTYDDSRTVLTEQSSYTGSDMTDERQTVDTSMSTHSEASTDDDQTVNSEVTSGCNDGERGGRIQRNYRRISSEGGIDNDVMRFGSEWDGQTIVNVTDDQQSLSTDEGSTVTVISVNNPSTRTEPSTSTPNNEPTTQARALTESTVQGTTFARAHTSHAARTSHQADATEVVPWTGRTGRHDIEEITVDPDARDSQHVVYTTRQNGAIGHLTTSWPPLTPPPNYYEVEHTVHVNGGVGGVAGSAIAMPCSSTIVSGGASSVGASLMKGPAIFQAKLPRYDPDYGFTPPVQPMLPTNPKVNIGVRGGVPSAIGYSRWKDIHNPAEDKTIPANNDGTHAKSSHRKCLCALGVVVVCMVFVLIAMAMTVYVIVSDGGASSDVNVVYGSMRMTGVSFTLDLLDPDSERSQKLSNQICYNIESTFAESTVSDILQLCNVTSFQNGSVVVFFDLHIEGELTEQAHREIYIVLSAEIGSVAGYFSALGVELWSLQTSATRQTAVPLPIDGTTAPLTSSTSMLPLHTDGTTKHVTSQSTEHVTSQTPAHVTQSHSMKGSSVTQSSVIPTMVDDVTQFAEDTTPHVHGTDDVTTAGLTESLLNGNRQPTHEYTSDSLVSVEPTMTASTADDIQLVSESSNVNNVTTKELVSTTDEIPVLSTRSATVDVTGTPRTPDTDVTVSAGDTEYLTSPRMTMADDRTSQSMATSVAYRSKSVPPTTEESYTTEETLEEQSNPTDPDAQDTTEAIQKGSTVTDSNTESNASMSTTDSLTDDTDLYVSQHTTAESLLDRTTLNARQTTTEDKSTLSTLHYTTDETTEREVLSTADDAGDHHTTEGRNQPTTEEVDQPTTEGPNQPTTGGLDQHTTEEPNQLTTQEPIQLTTQEPIQLTTKEVNQQTTVEPNQPTTEEPNQPTTEEPNFPTTKEVTYTTDTVMDTTLGEDEATTVAPPDVTTLGMEQTTLSGCYSGRCKNGGICEESDQNPSGFTCTCSHCSCSNIPLSETCEFVIPSDMNSLWISNPVNCSWYFIRDNSRYIEAPGCSIQAPIFNPVGGYCDYAVNVACFIQPTTTPREETTLAPGSDPCVGSPCMNGGTCIPHNSTTMGSYYTCQCPAVPCMCADQGERCQFASDGCTEKIYYSYHLSLHDLTCATYYRCDGAGGIDAHGLQQCTAHNGIQTVLDTSSGTCISQPMCQTVVQATSADPSADPCDAGPCNSGTCIMDMASSMRYRCECPPTSCSCARQGVHCEYEADDCEGAEGFSYHLHRDDPECRQWYRCNHAGYGVLMTGTCEAGMIHTVDMNDPKCVTADLTACPGL